MTKGQKYNHQEVERKWQERWIETGLYRTPEGGEKPKFYVLDMFPYPSGAGLHVGHPKGYIATDVVARQKMMQGYKVLHPMGWDAFGLPAENFALKNHVHPREAVEKNIAVFKKQLAILGFTYDWEREIKTTDPSFYKWTQWIFEQMYQSYYDTDLDKAQPIEKLIEKKFGKKKEAELTEAQKRDIDGERLAFEDFAPINWCPSCKTGLANEDLEDGHCERCGSVVEKKPLRQWNLRITKYADRLLKDLQELDWEQSIKVMQENWIGRSEGAKVRFEIKIAGQVQTNKLEVFTTRADTLSGVTYVVMAPEKARLILEKVTNRDEVEDYISECEKKEESERTDMTREKTGVRLADAWAINPINQEEVPVWVADYVLGDYGTGAVMAVPAHDERDFAFATKYSLPIKEVIKQNRVDEQAKAEEKKSETNSLPMTEDGILINSGKYDGLKSTEAREKIVADLECVNSAEKKVSYKLRDWVFSRQRYWGEPIPMIHCKNCGNVLVPESDLPLKLPEVAQYEPSGTGESPLATIPEWVETTCPICGEKARRETNTMPQWAGSSWYYLRYLDPHNQEKLVSKEKEKEMMPVDLYVGGAEHATRHLIYARFYHKFLYDIGAVSTKEPFSKLQHVGLILAEDGRKMSKRWGNVINPDEIAATYGADALRVYEMFMGPFAQPAAWNTQGVVGVRKFLEKVWQLREKVRAESEDEEAAKKKLPYTTLLHQTIAKVTEEIEDFKFNTVVSGLMILVNKMQEGESVWQKDYGRLLQLLAPLAPHIAEELWQSLNEETSVFESGWPKAEQTLMEEEMIKLPVQVNGKLRAQVSIGPAEWNDQEKVWEKVQQESKMKPYLEENELVKLIYVPKKIMNVVVKPKH